MTTGSSELASPGNVWLGRERTHLPRCASTNDEAVRLSEAGAVHGTVVTADAQSAGRGRRGRHWHSPAGQNLYLSCLLRPDMDPAQAPAITLAAGIGVCEAVAALLSEHRGGKPQDAPLQPMLKWPNDVRVDGRKLAGILTEMATSGERVHRVVVGVGINVWTRAFPSELADTATSLALLGALPSAEEKAKHSADAVREHVLARVLAAMAHWFERFFAGGVAAIAEPFLSRVERGRVQAIASEPETGRQRTVRGHVIGLDDVGCLMIEDDDGGRHRIIAGDVEVVTP